jgi:hypothetical protein
MRKLTPDEITAPDIVLRFKDGEVPADIIRELEPYGIEWGSYGGIHKVTIPGYMWPEIEAMMPNTNRKDLDLEQSKWS